MLTLSKSDVSVVGSVSGSWGSWVSAEGGLCPPESLSLSWPRATEDRARSTWGTNWAEFGGEKNEGQNISWIFWARGCCDKDAVLDVRFGPTGEGGGGQVGVAAFIVCRGLGAVWCHSAKKLGANGKTNNLPCLARSLQAQGTLPRLRKSCGAFVHKKAP